MNNQNISPHYDSDFDEPKEMSPPLFHGAIGQLPPRVLFGAGVITAILVLGTIGFFVLLSLLIKGGGLKVVSPAVAADSQLPARQ